MSSAFEAYWQDDEGCWLAVSEGSLQSALLALEQLAPFTLRGRVPLVTDVRQVPGYWCVRLDANFRIADIQRVLDRAWGTGPELLDDDRVREALDGFRAHCSAADPAVALPDDVQCRVRVPAETSIDKDRSRLA